MRIALFVTCLTETFYPRSAIALVKLLEHFGHTVEFPPEQTCCGQPMWNNGLRAEAGALIARMATIFDGYERVVTPSASCASMVREYGAQAVASEADRARAIALAERTREGVEFLLEEHEEVLVRAAPRLAPSLAIHDSCHTRALGTRGSIERLLTRLGADLLPLEKHDQCCGFGGTFATKYPAVSGAMVADKVDCIRRSGATTLVSSDAGCTLNLSGACRRAEHELHFRSIYELLAEGLDLLDSAPAIGGAR